MQLRRLNKIDVTVLLSLAVVLTGAKAMIIIKIVQLL